MEHLWNKLQNLIARGIIRVGKGYEVRVFRLGRKTCPIQIDWSEIIDMRKGKKEGYTYLYDNPPFKIKDNAEKAEEKVDKTDS